MSLKSRHFIAVPIVVFLAVATGASAVHAGLCNIATSGPYWFSRMLPATSLQGQRRFYYMRGTLPIAPRLGAQRVPTTVIITEGPSPGSMLFYRVFDGPAWGTEAESLMADLTQFVRLIDPARFPFPKGEFVRAPYNGGAAFYGGNIEGGIGDAGDSTTDYREHAMALATVDPRARVFVAKYTPSDEMTARLSLGDFQARLKKFMLSLPTKTGFPEHRYNHFKDFMDRESFENPEKDRGHLSIARKMGFAIDPVIEKAGVVASTLDFLLDQATVAQIREALSYAFLLSHTEIMHYAYGSAPSAAPLALLKQFFFEQALAGNAQVLERVLEELAGGLKRTPPPNLGRMPAAFDWLASTISGSVPQTLISSNGLRFGPGVRPGSVRVVGLSRGRFRKPQEMLKSYGNLASFEIRSPVDLVNDEDMFLFVAELDLKEENR